LEAAIISGKRQKALFLQGSVISIIEGRFMKNAKCMLLLVFGLIIALFTGCFSPLSVLPLNVQEKTAPEGQEGQPFTVDVYVGPQDGQERSIAGASPIQIKSGLYNFIQLVVLDETTGAIAAFEEVRQNSSAEEDVVLQINSLAYERNYKFLLLFGYWERNAAGESTDDNGVTAFAYNETAKPVLLAAGYKTQQLLRSEKVTVTMWPLVIDTVFTADGRVVNPVIGQAAEILQGETWKVKWNIGRNTGGGVNGLTGLLEAQSRDADLPVVARKYIMDGAEYSSEGGGNTTNIVEYSLPVKDEITDIGTTYWVNFNREYVPFNLTEADWSGYNSKSKFNLASSAPTWIIRNGLNDQKQDGNTDFARAGKPGEGYNYKDYNGNGGVAAQVKENLGFTDLNEDGFPDGATDTGSIKDGYPDGPGTADPNDLIIYGGKFQGPADTKYVKINFSTAGYTGNATVYYGIVQPGTYNADNPLPYGMFNSIPLGVYGPGSHNNVSITLPDAVKEYDIWLVFMKDGRISNRIAINTGSIYFVFPWG
jgi:hypothetical protein